MRMRAYSNILNGKFTHPTLIAHAFLQSSRSLHHIIHITQPIYAYVKLVFECMSCFLFDNATIECFFHLWPSIITL